MVKALSILEIIIVILIISIILSFSIPKFTTIFYNTNLSKLKTDVVLIQNGITSVKKKRVLLENYDEIKSLDEANSLISSEKLFTKVLQFPLISTSIEEKENGKWLKRNSKSYEFILSSSKKVLFELNDSSFKCLSPTNICEELY